LATAGTPKTLETLTPDETSTAVWTAAIAVIIATPRIPETSTTVRNIKSGSTRKDWSIRDYSYTEDSRDVNNSKKHQEQKDR
jgi:hypothetical protein